MNWKRKAAITNLISKLPLGLSYSAYYMVQRRFGKLQDTNPLNRLEAAVKIAVAIQERGACIDGKTFCEIGTGRRINIPIGLWLCGASDVITVDLNPYLEPELVMADIEFMREHRDEVEAVFRCMPAFPGRFDVLMDSVGSLSDLLALTNIRYMAPADARSLDIPSGSIDYHISYTVFEHIPVEIISDMLREARRILRKDGLHIHTIDFSDHFSHSDRSISAVNFLQYSDEEWDRYAGNRFQYHNRLRLDDYTELFAKSGLQMLRTEHTVDDRSLQEITSGFPIDDKFACKPPSINATQNAFILAQNSD